MRSARQHNVGGRFDLWPEYAKLDYGRPKASRSPVFGWPKASQRPAQSGTILEGNEFGR